MTQQFPTTFKEFEFKVQEYKNSFPLGFDYDSYVMTMINKYTIDNTFIPYDSKIVYLDMTVPCNLSNGITNEKIIKFINKVSQVCGLQQYIILNKTINSYLLGSLCNNLDELYYANYLLNDQTCEILFSKYSQFEKLYASMANNYQISDIQKNELDIKLTELFELRSHKDKLSIFQNYRNIKDDMFRLNKVFDVFSTRDKFIDLT
jgi:hypothetical protein